MNYPPEFSISVTGQFGQFVLECLECGVHHVFNSGTNWETIDIERNVHTQMHLRELLMGARQ